MRTAMKRFAAAVPAVAREFLVVFSFAASIARAEAIREVPDPLEPPAGAVLSLSVHAVGVQIYRCSAAPDNPSGFGWTFVAPEADLFDSSGRRMGRHYAGPTWEATDGSKVVGALKAAVESPEPTAIPWLLLRAKSTEGHGVLSRTTSIQRLRTVGGKAPSQGCSQARAGQETKAPYRAEYDFYVAQP